MLATFTLFLLFVISASCSRTADAAALSGPTIELAMATPQQVADFLPSLSDVQSRVLPTLSDAASAARLSAELTQLVTAFNIRDSQEAQHQIELARATLAAYPAAARAVDAVELSVIDIVLDRAAQLLGMPALPNRIVG